MANYRAFSYDVTMSAIIVSQNNETASMLLFQTNPVRVKPSFFFCKNFLLFQQICIAVSHMSENALQTVFRKRPPFNYLWKLISCLNIFFFWLQLFWGKIITFSKALQFQMSSPKSHRDTPIAPIPSSGGEEQE